MLIKHTKSMFFMKKDAQICGVIKDTPDLIDVRRQTCQMTTPTLFLVGINEC